MDSLYFFSLDNEAFFILQGECGITNALNSKTILVTCNASSCVILALYDTKKKMAFFFSTR